MAGNQHLWKSRELPLEPSLEDVLWYWRRGNNTTQIASALGVREHVIYNILARRG